MLSALVIFLLGVLVSLALSLYFLRYLAEGRRLRAVRIGVALFELGSVGGLFFLFSTHRTDGWAGMLTLPIILLLVAQLLVLASLCLRMVCASYGDGRKTLHTMRGVDAC